MVGPGKGSMQATSDLELGTMVSMDHQEYEVVAVTSLTSGCTVVSLATDCGPFEEIEVATVDIDEPIWEVA